MIVSVFVAVTPDEVRRWRAEGSRAEAVRHERIDSVIEATTLKGMFEVRTEHDFTSVPTAIPFASPASLLAALAAEREDPGR